MAPHPLRCEGSQCTSCKFYPIHFFSFERAFDRQAEIHAWWQQWNPGSLYRHCLPNPHSILESIPWTCDFVNNKLCFWGWKTFWPKFPRDPVFLFSEVYRTEWVVVKRAAAVSWTWVSPLQVFRQAKKKAVSFFSWHWTYINSEGIVGILKGRFRILVDNFIQF